MPNLMVDHAYERVLEETDFYHNGKPMPGLIDTEAIRAKGQLEILSKYGAIVDPLQLNASSIFELSGQPCIYFTRLSGSRPGSEDFHRLQKLAWNHGSAPMLWVITPEEVLLFNSFLKPEPEDEHDYSRYLLRMFSQTERGLRELREFASRLEIESGRFWKRPEVKRVSRAQRVDAALLTDLQETEQLLVNTQLDRSIAHSLLGRAIFVTYLQHRQILTKDFLNSRFQVEQFTDALNSKAITYDIFRWIRNTFNGDLFPLTVSHLAGQEVDFVEDVHLQIIRDFFSGTEMRSRQARFWPYRFDVIPIELISSIYEHFVHAHGSDVARQQSIHYTPVNLVDLTLSQVFDGLPSDAKLADLSCGSGLFLVESLRRLVAKRVSGGEELTRTLVRDTLYNQIFGIDINREAVQIAVFSLYLALLELDPHPEPPEDLSFQPLINQNLFVADAFDENATFNFQAPFATRELSAVVGNPPWKRSPASTSAVKYCKKRNYPLALNTPDQAFLWRIGDFSNENTRIGLIVHAKPYFSKTDKAVHARSSLFKRYRPHLIVNLSSLRKDGLFPNSSAPAIIYIADNRETAHDDIFTFVRVAWSESYKRHGIIELGPEGVFQASTTRVIEDPDWLKIASTGGPRDLALLDRLRANKNYVSFENLVRRFRWVCGRGLEPSRSGVLLSELLEELPTRNFLPSGKMPRYRFDVGTIQRSAMPERARRGYSTPSIYEQPLLICTRGIPKQGFYSAVCDSDIVYSEEFVGFSAANGHAVQRHYLNAILNSTLATYLLFLMGSVWGVERDKVEKVDLLRIPIPDPEKVSASLMQRVLNIESSLHPFLEAGIENELRNQLDEAVFDLYALTDTERIMVHDFVDLTVDLHAKRGRSRALKTPEITDLTAYATALISVIRPFLMTLGETQLTAEIIDAGSSPLRVIKFEWVPGPIPASEEPIRTLKVDQLRPIFEDIAKNLPAKFADVIYSIPTMRIYHRDTFYVIKPSQLRYWSRTAGFNDADHILSEHLNRTNGASSQAA